MADEGRARAAGRNVGGACRAASRAGERELSPMHHNPKSGRRPVRRAPGLVRPATAAVPPRHDRRPAPPGTRFVPIQSLEPRLMLSVTRDANGFTVAAPGANSGVISGAAGASDAASGASPGTATSLVHGLSLMRSGFPDQLLLRRGDGF